VKFLSNPAVTGRSIARSVSPNARKAAAVKAFSLLCNTFSCKTLEEDPFDFP
jgi:hypothetical protein